MTIDEAIKQARAEAELQRKYAKEIRERTREAYLDYGESEEQCADEHEQLAEWLEELKAIKDGSIPIIHGKVKLELHDKEIRNKAIDEYKTILMENCMAEIVNKKVQKIIEIHEILEIAEQLKGGVGE